MFYCGIDIAKAKHVAVVLDDHGEMVQSAFDVPNTLEGFQGMCDRLAALDGPVTIGLEATGHYWLALYEALTPDYLVLVVNPLQVAAYRKCGIRKCKTDPSDASWIADLLRIGQVTPSPVPAEAIVQLRELTRFRHHLTEVIGDCKRKALTVLDRVFPEYATLFSDVFLASSRRVLAEAVTAEEVAAFDLDELATLLRQASRGRWGQEKAAAIQQAAQHSVGVRCLADAARLEMHCLLEQIALLLEQRARVEAQIAEYMTTLASPITSIPGIGAVTGATILAEIGDVQRFAQLEHLVAYAGIDASVHQSGQFTGSRNRMSKRGSPYLRHALWQSAFMAIQYDPELKAYYASRRAAGKAHGTVLGAICRKLLARIMVVLKQNRPYEVRASS
jgi:transposase